MLPMLGAAPGATAHMAGAGMKLEAEVVELGLGFDPGSPDLGGDVAAVESSRNRFFM